MSLALHQIYITAQGPVSEMTYTVSSGTLNSSIPYHWVITSTKEVMFLTLYPQHYVESCRTNINKIFGGMGYEASNGWLDFAGDQGRGNF